MLLLFIVLAVLVIAVSIFAYWRYVFFYRDPERTAPGGSNIVAPADGGAWGGPVGGGVVYVKEFKDGKIPVSRKKGHEVDISELTKAGDKWVLDGYLIGIFLSPFDVHTQRAPVSGVVETVRHWQNENVLLAPMWWRIFRERLRGGSADQFPSYPHILENERTVMAIKGRDFPGHVIVVLIADKTVNQLTSLVKEGETVEKGQRIAKIGFKGSQVDVIIPQIPGLKVLVKTGDRVKAGETVLATYLDSSSFAGSVYFP